MKSEVHVEKTTDFTDFVLQFEKLIRLAVQQPHALRAQFLHIHALRVEMVSIPYPKLLLKYMEVIHWLHTHAVTMCNGTSRCRTSNYY